MTTPESKGDIVARPDGVHVAQGDGSGTKKADYDRWDWKDIMTAITGVGASGGLERDKLISSPEVNASNPETLWSAAVHFRVTQELLAMVGKSIADQTKALAGEGGPWQGEAATVYRGWMERFAKAFYNHAEQIGGGVAAQKPVPEQLWTAGNYLSWAINTIHEIDGFYANEALRIAALKGEDIVIENEKQGNTVHVSKYPEIVELLNRDMRKVLKTLASEYESEKYDAELVSVPTPDPFTSKGGPGDVDLSKYVPPPVPNVGPPPPYTPPPPIEIPPPGGSVPPPGGQGGNYNPGSFDPGKFDPGKFDSGNYNPGSFDPGNFDSGRGGPGQFNAGGSGPGAFDPGAFTPGNASVNPPPGTSFGPGGPGQSVFDPNDFTGGTGPGGPGLSGGGGTAFVPPPSSFGPITPPPTTGRGSTNTPGGSNSQGPGQFTPGAPDTSTPFKPGQFPGISVPDPNNWAAGQGAGSAGDRDRNGISTPGMPPPGAPFAPGASGASSSERPDSSGLVSGGTEPWEGPEIPGLGDPQASQKPSEWTAPGSGGVGVPGAGGGMPPGAPFAPAAGNGANGSERSDASGLIGGETEPWEGLDVPGLGDPSGGTVPQLPAETWAASSGEQVATAGVPMMPGVPFAPAAANGANDAPERSEASGLVAGGTEAWEGVEVVGLGDSGGVEALPASREEWARATDAQPVPFIPMVHSAPGGPGEKRREAVAGAPSDLGVQAPSTTDDHLRGAAVDGAPPVAEDDRVAVVTPDDGTEDFNAWDAGASAGLPWLLTSSRSEDERDEEPETPDYTLRETTGWGHTAGSTGVVRRDDTPVVAAMDISNFVPRFRRPEMEVHSSGLDAPEETERAEETDDSEEEQDERSSADLLQQDEKAWAGNTRPKASPGVIE